MTDLFDLFDSDFEPTPLPGKSMDPRELSEAWKGAKPAYLTDRETYHMVLIDTAQSAYGDWKLYQDPTTDKYYTEFESIGD